MNIRHRCSYSPGEVPPGSCKGERTNREENASKSKKASLQEQENAVRGK